VDHRVDLDDVEKRKFLTLLGLELRHLDHPARSQSLYRVRYPGYFTANVHVPVSSRVTGDMSVFHKIRRMFLAFLPALHELQRTADVEVRFSVQKPRTHGLLDCLVVSIVLDRHVVFQEPEQVVVLQGQTRAVGRIGDEFPACMHACIVVLIGSLSRSARRSILSV
jgi:hypothetical protein